MGTRVESDFAADKAERTIAGWILSGKYGEGEQLPAMPTLMKEFGISEATLSKALGRLRTRRLVHFVPGHGAIVNSLNEFVGLETLWPMLDHCDLQWRRIVLLCQFYDFLRPLLAEWTERAALRRSEDQLEWLERYTALLEGRLGSPESDRVAIRRAEYEFARVLAAAAENICFTMTLNQLEELFLSDALVQGADTIVPVATYRAIVNAVKARDGKHAAQLIEEALWNRETACIAELRKLGWTTTGIPLPEEPNEAPNAA